MGLRHRAGQIGNALSQFLNTLLGGWSDESVSSRSWRLSNHSARWRLMRRLIDWLFRPFSASHCKDAFFNERMRLNMPPELRNPPAP